MTPVQSQPLGQYPLAAPTSPGAGRTPAPTAATALNATFSPIRSTIDGVQASLGEWQTPNPNVSGPIPNLADGNPNAQPTPTQGSTGNSFLDLISQLMNQLDSFITGLGSGTNATGGGAVASPAPVCTTTLQPNPESPAPQPDPGGSAMRQLLATGEVT